jgi:hypothetical protein
MLELILRTNACFAFAILVGIPTNCRAAPSGADDAAGKAWAAYSQAQGQYQQEMADFLSSRHAELKEVIVLSLDMQLALIERRSLEFRYLLATHPERIVRNQGISQFANFAWTDKDAHALRNSNPAYSAAPKRVETLRQRSQEHPQWPALRAANQSLAKDPEYQAIYQRFDQRVKEAEKLLAVRR